jgi:hypothetical protein
MGRLVATVAVALVVGVAGAGAAAPPQLVGKWTRTVTQPDITRAHANGLTPGSFWTLVVRKSGTAFAGGSAGQFSGTIVPAGANRVHVNVGTACQNVYTWHTSGKTLTFAKVKDCEPDRVAAFNGVWRKSG